VVRVVSLITAIAPVDVLVQLFLARSRLAWAVYLFLETVLFIFQRSLEVVEMALMCLRVAPFRTTLRSNVPWPGTHLIVLEFLASTILRAFLSFASRDLEAKVDNLVTAL